jgi:hypothetical protein
MTLNSLEVTKCCKTNLFPLSPWNVGQGSFGLGSFYLNSAMFIGCGSYTVHWNVARTFKVACTLRHARGGGKMYWS